MQIQNYSKTWPILSGVVIAIIICFIIYLLPLNYGQDFFALLLAGFSSIYLSAAFSENKISMRIIEFFGFIFFISIALASLYYFLLILLAGYLLQVIWHYFHFAQRFGVKTNKSIPLFCLIFNSIITLYIIIFSL